MTETQGEGREALRISEDAQQARRDTLIPLCASFLKQTAKKVGPQYDTEDQLDQMFSDEDIFSMSLTKIAEHPFSKKFSEWRSLVKLAQFYDKRTDLYIPERIISGLDVLYAYPGVDEKVVILLNDTNNRTPDQYLQFPDALRKKPDIFIENATYGKILLQGVDNVTLAGKLSAEGPISGSGTFTILPGAELGHKYGQGYLSNTTLHMEGDIVQEDTSNVSALKIDCNNYLKKGGAIHPSSSLFGKPLIITCEGQFIGENPQTGITIVEHNSTSAPVEENDLPLTEKQAKQQFATFTPEKEERTYRVNAFQLPKLQTLAEQLGWKIKTVYEEKGDQVVVIQKSES